MERHPSRDDKTLLHELHHRLRFWLLVLLSIGGAGVVGFHLLEHCPWLEAAYKTICVLSTLGLSTHPANPASTVFTIVLALGGIGSFVYAANAIVRLMVSEEYQRVMAHRKVMIRMKRLHDHYIICGYGRIGQIVARHLHEQQQAYGVIDRDPEIYDQLQADGKIALRGDASHEDTLELAGLARARTLIIVTSSDAENVLITMTARQLHPTIPIIVRCDEEANYAKFIRAGASRVITLNTTGAAQIALAATKPYVIDLIDLATGTGRQEFQMRQIMVPDGSSAHEQTLINLALGSRFGVIVIGIKSRGQEMQFNPSAQTRLTAGDMLITVGREEKFRELEIFLGAAKI